MSYQPYDRQPSGIVFFGPTASDQVYESVSNFIYDSGSSTVFLDNLNASSTVTADNIIVSNGSTIGSADTNNAITIAADGSISILKNLTVNGTTTTVNSTTLTVEDPIIILGSGTPISDDNKDRGVSFNYYDTDSDSAKIGFFGFDDSSGKFTFIPDATISNEVVSGASGTIVADLQGNADTATKWADTVNIQLTDHVTGSGDLDGSTNISFDVQLTADAINDQTEATSANNTDYLIIASGTSLRKITKSNFVADVGAGTMSSFTVSADNGSDQTIENANTLEFTGGSGIITTAIATDTIVFDINTDNSTLEVNSDTLRIKDFGVTEVKRSRTIESVTSSKTADKDITLVDATSSNITISLPENANSGRIMVVKRKDGSSNTVVVQRTGSDTIDGSNSWQLYYRFETLTFVSDGADWYII